MPLKPDYPIGAPHQWLENVPFASVVLGSDLTTEVGIAPFTGYLSAMRLVPVGAATADATNYRTWGLVVGTAKAPTDGCIVDPASGKGAWAAATAYTTGQWVVLNNLPYVCIVNVTGGTGPGVDTSHWQAVARVGLQWVNTLTVLSKDDIGKVITDAGNTNFASSFVGDVAIFNGASAMLLVSVAPRLQDQFAADAVTRTPQPVLGSAANAVTATAAITRTVTIGTARTAATFSCNGAVNLVAGTEIDGVLGTDVRVYKGDLIKLTSTHVASGVADPGGTLQVELTSWGEGAQ